jgi:hypothetical protein
VNDLYWRILALFPAAKVGFNGKVQLADAGDGNGPQIVQWDATLDAQPTAQQLAAVTAGQIAAAQQQQREAAAQSLLGDQSPTGVALRAVYLAAGLTAQQVAAQLAAADQAGASPG